MSTFLPSSLALLAAGVIGAPDAAAAHPRPSHRLVVECPDPEVRVSGDAQAEPEFPRLSAGARDVGCALADPDTPATAGPPAPSDWPACPPDESASDMVARPVLDSPC